MRASAVKFCGITNLNDLNAAIKVGVDAIGLVFYPPSPRAVDIQQAQSLAKAVPAFTTVVALVVNIDVIDLTQLAEQVPFDVIQFHGDESPQQCQMLAHQVNKRWIKAIRVTKDHTAAELSHMIDELHECGASGVLLDAYHPDKFGGTGEQFDWQIIPTHTTLPIILAGGLTPDNVSEAARHLAIYGVDVSGGIERHKGQKDSDKMCAFMKAVTDERWQL